MAERQIHIASRASPLAVAQTQSVADALCAAHKWDATQIQLHRLTTRGDKIQDRPLAEIGGKGLFTAELDAGLYDGTFDIAVHSLKDLPTAPTAGLVLAAILPRAAAHDVLICKSEIMPDRAGADVLAALPVGTGVGTASLRRAAQILHCRPDIRIVSLRGNIGTRLKKLQASSDLDAIVLAAAGLDRLAHSLPPTFRQVPLPSDIMLPAAGQGALAVQCRSEDSQMIDWLAPLHCPITAACVTAERSFLAALDGSCRTPIAAWAYPEAQQKAGVECADIHLQGRVIAHNGAQLAAGAMSGRRAAAATIGQELAAQLRRTSPDVIAQLIPPATKI